MKLNVALFFAGLFGAFAAFFILLSFGTNYWLLVSETYETHSQSQQKNSSENSTIYYHEGFFLSCSVEGNVEDDMFALLFTNSMRIKNCKPSYMLPFPVPEQVHNSTIYNSAVICRGFWSVFVLLGVIAVILGGFFIICAAPFSNYCLYKTGGALFLIAGFFLLLATVLYVMWFELVEVSGFCENYHKTNCSVLQLHTYYGPSFMSAPVGVFFCLLSGLLFLLIARTVRLHYN